MNLFGPLPVRVYVEGLLTEQLAEGLHFTTDAQTYAENEEVLSPFRVYPNKPLQFVIAGDSHDLGYVNTIPLRFADETELTSILPPIDDIPLQDV